ncbi:MAG: UDP-N-acetylglucosamine pyrophosphorylase [Clostridia bacterium]|nr:UDP-N-acetylglucosamine pyrophosphorylase [Clostridia bacterium]
MTPLYTVHLLNPDYTNARSLLERAVFPWEILPQLKDFILALGETLSAEDYDRPAQTVWIHKSAKVAPTAHIGERVIIGAETEVRHCAFIRGDALIGKSAVVGNSTEIKNALLFDGVQVPHYNYVGDSILGHKAHLGAGVVLSNFRSDHGAVPIHWQGKRIETGLRKFGAILADGADIGCNSVLNPGTVIGRNTVVYPLSMVRGVVAANSIYKKQGEIVEKRE